MLGKIGNQIGVNQADSFMVAHPLQSSLAGRIVPLDRFGLGEQNCCSPGLRNRIGNVMQSVGLFFKHRCQDIQLFARSFGSILNPMNRSQLDARVAEIGAFYRGILGYSKHGDAIQQRALINQYFDLSPAAKRVLPGIDSAVLNRFFSPMNDSQESFLRGELLRKCRQAISFQSTMRRIVRCCCPRTVFNAVGSPTGSRGQPSRTVQQHPARREDRHSNQEGVQINNLNQLNNRPLNSVAYDPNNIPREVLENQRQIRAIVNQLRGLNFGNLVRFPAGYQDPVARMRDPNGIHFYEIPVYDPTHPRVHNGAVQYNIVNPYHAIEHTRANEMIRRAQSGELREFCQMDDQHQYDLRQLRIDIQLQRTVLTYLRIHHRGWIGLANQGYGEQRERIRRALHREQDRVREVNRLVNANDALPGIPYDRNAIPADVQARSQQIDLLEARLAVHNNGRAEAERVQHPAEFISSHTNDFYRIPVYDATHPLRQNGADGLHPRHAIDFDQMNLILDNAGDDETFCICGEHEYDLNQLQIDSALQQRIIDHIEGIVGRQGQGQVNEPNQAPAGGAAMQPLPERVDYQIPGTTPYDIEAFAVVIANPDPIAEDDPNPVRRVVRKSRQIQELSARLAALTPHWARLRGNVAEPDFAYAECPIDMEIISLPVFDASHCAGFAAAVENAQGDQALQEAEGRLNDRNLRHTVSHERMGAMLNGPEAGRNCQTCRNPLQRQNLVVDEGLQDRVLQELTALNLPTADELAEQLRNHP